MEDSGAPGKRLVGVIGRGCCGRGGVFKAERGLKNEFPCFVFGVVGPNEVNRSVDLPLGDAFFALFASTSSISSSRSSGQSSSIASSAVCDEGGCARDVLGACVDEEGACPQSVLRFFVGDSVAGLDSSVDDEELYAPSLFDRTGVRGDVCPTDCSAPLERPLDTDDKLVDCCKDGPRVCPPPLKAERGAAFDIGVLLVEALGPGVVGGPPGGPRGWFP